jgi:hypothetical protein
MTSYERLGVWVDKSFSSRTEAAKKSGMSSSQLGDYIAGRKAPGGPILTRWAKLGLNLQWWATGEGPMFVEPEPPDSNISLIVMPARMWASVLDTMDLLTEKIKDLKSEITPLPAIQVEATEANEGVLINAELIGTRDAFFEKLAEAGEAEWRRKNSSSKRANE